MEHAFDRYNVCIIIACNKPFFAYEEKNNEFSIVASDVFTNVCFDDVIYYKALSLTYSVNLSTDFSFTCLFI